MSSLQPKSDTTTWRGLVHATTADLEASLSFFDDIGGDLRDVGPPDVRGDLLGGVVDTLTMAYVVAGDAAGLAVRSQVAPYLPLLIGDLAAPTGDEMEQAADWTLGYVNLLPCSGEMLPSGADALEAQWLPMLTETRGIFRESAQHALALACCAAGLPALAPRFLKNASIPARFTPGETFGFNVPGFALALASALQTGAEFSDIKPAWLDFVHCFPTKLDVDTLDWTALLWAARAVYATIGGIPVADVGAELRARCTSSSRAAVIACASCTGIATATFW